MPKFVCVTCGVQYGESLSAPDGCPICQDARQYVGFDGQKWTTVEQMSGSYQNHIHQEEQSVYSIHTQPGFAIGQRGFLVQSGKGNLLWDCVSLLDESTIRAVRDLGGIDAIAISHPHYYASMVDWSAAFGDAPIYLHQADAQWVMRPDPRVRFWSGDFIPVLGAFTLVLTPGHYDGFQVLHWKEGASGRGVLFSGDQPQVCMDTNWVSFMYSYPNYIPLAPAAVRNIVVKFREYRFERIYGAFPHRTVQKDGNVVVERSAERYLQALGSSA